MIFDVVFGSFFLGKSNFSLVVLLLTPWSHIHQTIRKHFIIRLYSHRETSEDCRGCLECSRDNGCVRCPERLFLFLQREGMSHHGTCLHACPAGHYGQRGKDINRCMKCRSVDCEHCFSRDFCTKCKPGFHLYKGKCLTSCPEGTLPHNTDLDLKPGCCGNGWSEWSSCLRDGVTCGFRWGKQTRTRGGSRTPEEKVKGRLLINQL
uniref:R-spondin 4 n=1 Tax=Seriola dumerili TaxID=41447 RepID=A0A3B4TNE3_SERDU